MIFPNLRGLISPPKNKVSFLLFLHNFYKMLPIALDLQLTHFDILSSNKEGHRRVFPRNCRNQRFSYCCIHYKQQDCGWAGDSVVSRLWLSRWQCCFSTVAEQATVLFLDCGWACDSVVSRLWLSRWQCCFSTVAEQVTVLFLDCGWAGDSVVSRLWLSMWQCCFSTVAEQATVLFLDCGWEGDSVVSRLWLSRWQCCFSTVAEQVTVLFLHLRCLSTSSLQFCVAFFLH
jgi:hypothetical protein